MNLSQNKMDKQDMDESIFMIENDEWEMLIPDLSIPNKSKFDLNLLRFAHIRRLVELTILAFDSKRKLSKSPEDFPISLFLVHQWWLSTSKLGAYFFAAYKLAPKRCRHCLRSQSENYESPSVILKSCCVNIAQFRIRLCHSILLWLNTFPMHFDANNQMRRIVEKLHDACFNDEMSQLSALLDMSTVPSYAWLRNVSVRNPMIRQVSLFFEQWTPDEIASSLTHMEHRTLRRIPFSEFKQYASFTNLKLTPSLERSISSFNSLSNWVQCMILNKVVPKERAEIMTKFVNVGKNLRKLRNFNTLMSVVGAITHSSIARLGKTSACLSPDTKKELTSLTELLSNQGNFANYRKLLEESRAFKIPIIGVHLKDLIVMHTTLKDCDENGLINCKKVSQLASIFSHLILDLDRPHNIPEANIDLINTLKVSLDIYYKEDDIYELSLKREPRTFLSFQSTNHEPVVFADWAAGVCSIPDSETINKHVSAMVDAVFKHYDHNRDGYISKWEFEQIAGNFPFIDPFVAIDADRDGQISKDEMKKYFVTANRKSMAFRYGFKHNFHETTFIAPTLCIHCNKLMWGLIRQGYKCKDCGLPVHRICKDSAVAECRYKRNLCPVEPSISTDCAVGDEALAIPEDDFEFPNDNTISQRRRHFLNISGRRNLANNSNSPSNELSFPSMRNLFASKPTRLRVVSTTSESPSPEPMQATCKQPKRRSGIARANSISDTTVGCLNSQIRKNKSKNRASSETDDCYRCKSPEYVGESFPSLASEEVFEEESLSNLSFKEDTKQL